MMPLTVQVRIDDPRWKGLISEPRYFISQVCQLALKGFLKHATHPVEVAVVLTDDKAIQMLNHDYLGKDKPTNVLAFPIDQLNVGDLPQVQPDGTCQLGDVVLARETIEREALEQKKHIEHHVAHLLVHGCLHLMGHDHTEEAEAMRMERLEAEILAQMDIADPYHYTDRTA